MFWPAHGAIGGLIAGVVFMLFQMSAAVVATGADGALRPLRMVAAIVLGRAALDPSHSAVTAGLAGATVHLLLAALFGVLFGALLLVAAQSDVVMAGRTIVLVASVYGFVLWLMNFYIVAPVAGLSWFPDRSSPVVQFLAHTFCYGAVLGLYFQRMIAARARVSGPAKRPIDRPQAIRRVG
jgi:hypothetical protein